MIAGFLCVAVNTDSTDYVRLAYLQALSCKLTQRKNANFSVIVDTETSECLTEKQNNIFDKIIVVSNLLHPIMHEANVFNLSPYKRTIKTEADMLFTSDYSHMWNIYGQNALNFTSTAYTYDHQIVSDRSQRRLFDDNMLPDIYSAWTYFEYDLAAKKFYDACNRIVLDWHWYRDHYLVNCRYDIARTDEVYALAYNILRIHTADTKFGFVHMKPEVQDLPGKQMWTDQLDWQIQDDHSPVIGGFKQHRPLHYQLKTFATDQLIDRYEYEYRRLLG
jgi:hypothetical protein